LIVYLRCRTKKPRVRYAMADACSATEGARLIGFSNGELQHLDGHDRVRRMSRSNSGLPPAPHEPDAVGAEA